jgi:HEAT repeat protein
MMQDLWTALEERTRAWDALGRQRLANAVWEDYVSLRFGRTGDPRALEYLYPYLNDADRSTRGHALDVAARVFEGRGPAVVAGLGYFTNNPDLFLRDRAVIVVGAAVTGSRDEAILEALRPYLDSPNQFIRKLALTALGKAAHGQASPRVLAEIRRVARRPGPREDEVRMAIAHAFAGHPTEDVYGEVAGPQPIENIDRDSALATAVLVREAGGEWYRRACNEAFEPRLHAEDATGWRRDFIRRNGVVALAHAGAGMGMEPLNRMLPVRAHRTTGHAMMSEAPKCFAGADPANRAPLAELAKTGDVPAQRIAAVCLGRLLMGRDDNEAIGVLRELCEAKSAAVQAAALTGLGMAARSSCDEELRRLCLERVANPETAAAALRALGMIFLGSGRSDAFAEVRRLAMDYSAAPVRSRQYSKPLAACYRAAGLIYLGTGSLEPVPFLLDVLARPSRARYDEYHWAAARALVMVEFSEAALGWEYISSV